MDTDLSERAIAKELEKLSINLADIALENDTEFSGKMETEFNDLMQTFLRDSHYMNNFADVYKELDAEDITNSKLFDVSHVADHLKELNSDEDSTKLKDRILSELEAHLSDAAMTYVEDPAAFPQTDDLEEDIYKELEELFVARKELEEKHRKENEQQQTEMDVKGQQDQNGERKEEQEEEKEEEWGHTYKEFEEELRKIQLTTPFERHKTVSHLELIKHQELIRKFEKEIEEERRLVEEALQEKQKRAEEQRHRAATTIQSAYRALLVRRTRKKELQKKREHERHKEEERKKVEMAVKKREHERHKEEERKKMETAVHVKMQSEEKKLRAAEEEQHCKKEMEREQMLEEQKRREEEEVNRMEDENKRKQEEETKKRKEMEKTAKLKAKEEERRKRKEERRRKEEMKRKEEWQRKEEMKRKEEQTRKEKTKGKEEKKNQNKQNRKDEIENDNRANPNKCGKDRSQKLQNRAALVAPNNAAVPPTKGLKSKTDTRGRHSLPADVEERSDCCVQASRPVCLLDRTEQKRLAWMTSCTPWSVLSMQNKRRKISDPPQKRGISKASVPNLPPLPVDTVLNSGDWSSLRQVTTLTLEDLSGCSLSTLSECSRLRSLTLRRCGLQALDGLNQCSKLSHIDVQENSISYVDCGGLSRLKVLMLGRNKLTNIHGLDGAVNLTVLQLSHNMIIRISGLGSLKRLQRLSIDHNSLRCTKGLSEVCTLLYLDCSYNLLSYVEGLENCALLNTLDLRRNALIELPVLKNHVLLRELYVDDNIITSMDALVSCWLPLLRCLSVAQNSISQLPLLGDLLSLKTLDARHNSLRDLGNINESLQGCACLQELNITDNPVLYDANWRSSLLLTIPSLIKLNGEETGVSAVPPIGSKQLWTFEALCQVQQDQLNSVLQRHSTEVSSALSALEAQLLASKHSAELFRLAEIQRCAHEGKDNSSSETSTLETTASSCLQKLPDLDLTKNKKPEDLRPTEQQTQRHKKAHVSRKVHKAHPKPPSGDKAVVQLHKSISEI